MFYDLLLNVEHVTAFSCEVNHAHARSKKQNCVLQDNYIKMSSKTEERLIPNQGLQNYERLTRHAKNSVADKV